MHITSADFQNVNCIMFEQSIVYKIYTMYTISKRCQCVFLTPKSVKMQSGIGLIVYALFGNFAYLHNLYTVVELHKHFVLIHFGIPPSFHSVTLILLHSLS